MTHPFLKTEIITDWPRFYSLEPEWNELLVSSRSDTIFLTWEWMRAWIETVEERVCPFIIAIRDSAGKLAGLAPYYFGNLRFLNMISYRTLRVIGDYASGAEYLDCIARKDLFFPVIRELGRTLHQNRKQWDCIWMPDMSGWSETVESMAWVCEKNSFFWHIRPKKFSVFNMPKTMDSFLESFSSKRRWQLRRLSRKIFNHQGVRFTQCNDPKKLPVYLQALFDLHQKRWKSTGEKGCFRRTPVMIRFYRNFTKEALQKGWLKLFALMDNGDFKAVQIGYSYNGIFHQLQEGFDPEYQNGVGNILRLNVIENCIREGISQYDFMGGNSAHKRRWLAKTRTGYDILIGSPGPKTRLLFTKKIWPTGRFLQPDDSFL